jgi:hypothetical protein
MKLPPLYPETQRILDKVATGLLTLCWLGVGAAGFFALQLVANRHAEWSWYVGLCVVLYVCARAGDTAVNHARRTWLRHDEVLPVVPVEAQPPAVEPPAQPPVVPAVGADVRV